MPPARGDDGMLKLAAKFDAAGHGERWAKLMEATPMGDREGVRL